MQVAEDKTLIRVQGAPLPVLCRVLRSRHTVTCMRFLFRLQHNTLSKAGCRPAAILLHTPEADAALLRAADELGVACREVPPLKALRESLWSLWDSGIPPPFFPCHKLLEQP